ncbi:hypothetical protein [Flavobacterium sp.]|uniref:hypothetical protein n=1 Tax=Flavobacterium sp. TaxID=239 RepID=UPI003F69B489
MKKVSVLFLLIFIQLSWAQSQDKEQFPKFKNCNEFQSEELKKCFYATLKEHFNANFQVAEPDVNYKGTIFTLFEVDTLGKFNVLYIESNSENLKKETKRVFSLL